MILKAWYKEVNSTEVQLDNNQLDAYYIYSHGVSRNELLIILDPQEVHGEDFHGKSSRMSKERRDQAVREVPDEAADARGLGSNVLVKLNVHMV